jgi:hypothetical protein
MSATLRVRAALVLMLSVPAVANASTMALAWNANPESNLAGYILVYGTSSGNYSTSIDVGNNISYSVGALTAGTRYYFAVRAYTTTAAAKSAPRGCVQLRRSQRVGCDRQDGEQQ